MITIETNPFFVLGVAVDATRQEIEREAQKLLGMLELGFPEAKIYATPIGNRDRTAEHVRAAVASLRDPYQRLVAELWARHAPPVVPAIVAAPSIATPSDVSDLRSCLGWARKA